MAKKASIRSILHTRKPNKQQLQLDRIEEKIDALHTLNAEKFKGYVEAAPPAIHLDLNALTKSMNLILHHLANGRKIDAIQEYRAIFGTGLKESKDAVEGNGL